MKFIINGGGIAGLTAAIALEKLGYEIILFESAQEIKPVGAGLVLQSNSLYALEYLKIEDQIIEASNPINQLVIVNENGKIVKQQKASSKYRELFGGMAIHRHTLHTILKSYLDPGIIHTNKKAVSFSEDDEKVILHFSDGSSEKGDFIISADGINSVLRKQILPDSTPRYSGYICWRGVINNFTPKVIEATETWGSKGRFGIVPINENRIYWYATISGNINDARLNSFGKKELIEQFRNYHPAVLKVLEQTDKSEIIVSPICDLKPLNQFAYNRVLLIGDAAHATTPNLGQGACQAIEDAMVLHKELKSKQNVYDAFKSFEQKRTKKTKFIIDMSRRVGAIAQIENIAFGAIRNLIMNLTPEFVSELQLKKLYE